MRSKSPERAPPRSGGLQGRAAWLLPVVTYDLASILLLEAERDLVDRVWGDILGRSSSYRSPTTLPMAIRRSRYRRDMYCRIGGPKAPFLFFLQAVGICATNCR